MMILSIISLFAVLLIVVEANFNSLFDNHVKSRYENLATFEAATVRGDDYTRPLGASQLIAPTTATSCNSQQVHISVGNNENDMFITFVSSNSSVIYSNNRPCIIIGESMESVVDYDLGNPSTSSLTTATTLKCRSASYSQLIWITGNTYAPTMGLVSEPAAAITTLQNTSVWAYSIVNGVKQVWGNYKYLATGASPILGLSAYNNPYLVYDSPIINTATAKSLKHGQTYYYRPVDSCAEVFEFTMPPVAVGTQDDYPMMVGVSVDIGQTVISNASVAALLALDPAVVVLAGDLSYADGWYPLWDSFGNMMERLASKVPILTTGGNHEFQSSEAWASYNARYPTPSQGSGSTNPCYYGKEIGVMHVVALCAYAGYFNTSLQYEWLNEYLSTSLNRTKTPWLVAMMHVPWYSSNSGHWMEGELMRQSLEPILYAYGVDIVLVGHVHVYERTYPVYDNVVDECGPIHMTIGDGGNYEGTYVPWLTPQAAWSAFRESSFGVAGIEFLNETTAAYSWHRHACQSSGGTGAYYHINTSSSCMSPNDNSAFPMQTSDVTYLTRPSASQCPNRYVSTKVAVGVPATTDDDFYIELDDDDGIVSKDKKVIIGLAVATAILGASALGLAVALMFVNRKYLSLLTSTSATGGAGATGTSPIHSIQKGELAA